MENNRFLEVKKKLSSVYHKELFIGDAGLENLFSEYVGLLFSDLFGTTPHQINITEGADYSGVYNGLIDFDINKKGIEDFKEGKALTLFETIAHEFKHFHQKRDFNKVSLGNSFMEKDLYLKNVIPNYYEDNYYLYAQEVDAYLSQTNDAIALLNDLNITPSSEEINESIEKTKDFKLLTIRNVDGNVIDIYDAYKDTLETESIKFDEYDKKTFMDLRPCSNIEYKYEEGGFVRRTSNEVTEIYDSWKEGNIELPGKQLEIETYFNFTTEYLREIENTIIK